MQETIPALTLRELCKTYPAFRLEQVSFSVGQGRILGLIGRNGAGKTTTLKSILNIVHPDSGEIRFFGHPLSEEESAIKERIGFVSGGADYYGNKRLSVITDVTRRFYTNWDGAAYRDCLDRFELSEDKTPAQLSAGMRVKYALALALSHRAELLILDEPSSGLDPVSRDELCQIFLGLSREGVSILFSTHITSDLERCADDICYLRRGRVAECCTLKELERKYRLLTLTEAQQKEFHRELIGCRSAREGYIALTAADRLPELGGRIATLEEIMVHLDREDGHA